MTDNFRKTVTGEANAFGIELSEDKLSKLYSYYRMVVEKNKVMNLTAITDEQEFAIKHIADSMAIVKAGEEITSLLSDKGARLIDVGTGAGMPGIIIKIIFPDINMVLFDSLKKRLNFLDEVTAELGLKGISTLHGRAEDIGRDPKFRESFDIAVSRAVANLSTLSEYCLPLLKKGGVFLPYKSGDVEEELGDSEKAVRVLGGKFKKLIKYNIPDTDMGRSLIIIEKTGSTPTKYPRKAGIPSKEPLK